MKLETYTTFDDVLLVPQYSDIQSRSEVTLVSELSEDLELRVPIISAPMDTVCGEMMAGRLSEFGALGIIHRYNTIETQSEMVSAASNKGLKNVGAAIGITGDYLERATALIDAGASVLCLDVAHGDHVLMHVGAHKIVDAFGDKVHVMAGLLWHTLELIVCVLELVEAQSALPAFRQDTECPLLHQFLIVLRQKKSFLTLK